MHKLKQILTPAVALFLVCLCASTALALTNAVTKGAIAKQDQKKLNETMKKLIEASNYATDTITVDGIEHTYYTAKDDSGEALGFIFSAAASGYNGDVSVMVGINPDGNVKAVEILDASGETPGLGQRVTEKAFTDKFAAKSAPFDAQIDVISGATYSSRAVIKAVNTACDLYAHITDGGQGNE